MDPNKHLFLQEDHRDTFNRFYPYHEEMQRLFGVPVYEERKRVGRYLNTLPNLFGNSGHKNSESDSGISSPNLTDSILNSSDASLNSSSNTSGSDSSSSSMLDCFLKSFLSPRMNSAEPTSTTFRDSWLKKSPTPEKRQNSTTLHYSLFGNNTLDLTSQILKTPAETQAKSKTSIDHKCKCQICDASLTPSVDVQFGANDLDRGLGPEVSMSSSGNSRLGTSRVAEELRWTAPEIIPSFTGFAFPTAARIKKEKPKACKFCKKNGELPEVYNGHETKDIAERVTCPILRRYICELCGATGDNAHTRKYCPNYAGFEERLPLFRRLANGVISISHNHK